MQGGHFKESLYTCSLRRHDILQLWWEFSNSMVLGHQAKGAHILMHKTVLTLSKGSFGGLLP